MSDKLSPKPLAVTFTIIAFIFDIVGYVWHGLLGQPSLITIMYPGFWSNWNLMLTVLAACLASSYALGYAFAWIYNWALKKFR
ncbi:hypothetical protein EPN87_03915 [archaeon]|nr:MAG: hypothetical protein EPN87_03915 [archaeon]